MQGLTKNNIDRNVERTDECFWVGKSKVGKMALTLMREGDIKKHEQQDKMWESPSTYMSYNHTDYTDNGNISNWV